MFVLGRALRLVKSDHLIRPNAEQLKFSREAASKLMRIPGHAEYFGNRIWRSYDKFKSGYGEGKGGFYYPLYEKESRESFATLELLPSVETVKVLGEMLKEDWKWPDFAEQEKNGIQSPLDMRALAAIMQLPFADPPSRPLRHTTSLRENVGIWREWYSEIESGRRTFRFIGDETEYDLRGPVPRGGADAGSRVTRRLGGNTPQDEESPAFGGNPVRFWPYAPTLIFLAAGFWFFLRKKSV